MKTIDRKAAFALVRNKSFRLANTSVHLDQPFRYLKLHGNTIARVENATGVLEITTAGWNTVTTKARLNALPGVCVKMVRCRLTLNGQLWDGNWTAVPNVVLK